MKKIKFIIVLLVGLTVLPQAANAQFFKKALKALDKIASTPQQRSTNTQRSATKSKYSTSTQSKSSSGSVSQQKLVPSSNDEVTLVVSADGTSKEEATKVALRSAIEQAYGTFVSANTTILNDELVKDEIVTVTSGNIKEYKEIASERTPDGKTFVTLQATVCISKLVSYAKSKGASVEFAGATFGMNVKIEELNRKNEKIAIDNLVAQVEKMATDALFDFRLEIGEPKVMESDSGFGDYETYFNITAIPNDYLINIYELMSKTFNSLRLTKEDANRLSRMGIKTYNCPVLYDLKEYFKTGDFATHHNRAQAIITRNEYVNNYKIIPWA